MSATCAKATQKCCRVAFRAALTPDKKGQNIYVFRSRKPRKSKPKLGQRRNNEFNAPYDRKPSLEREYIYDHVWQQVKDKFYDKNLHGVDWKATQGLP